MAMENKVIWRDNVQFRILLFNCFFAPGEKHSIRQAGKRNWYLHKAISAYTRAPPSSYLLIPSSSNTYITWPQTAIQAKSCSQHSQKKPYSDTGFKKRPTWLSKIWMWTPCFLASKCTSLRTSHLSFPKNKLVSSNSQHEILMNNFLLEIILNVLVLITWYWETLIHTYFWRSIK